MSIKDLTPGQPIKTMSGLGTFVRLKQNNFRNQNYLIELASGERRWYTYEQLKQANKVILSEDQKETY